MNVQFTTYQAGLLQARAYRKLKNFMGGHLAPYDLTMMQWAVLGYVYDHEANGGVRTSLLASQFDVESSLMTNMVNDLEKRELLYREVDPDDSRARRVLPTQEGSKLVPTIEQKLRSSMDEWLDDVNRRHLLHYIKVLQTIAE